MHWGGRGSALAESFSTLNTLFSVTAEVRGAGTMACDAQAPAGTGSPLEYSLRRLSPEDARLEVRKDGAAILVLNVTEWEIVLADPAGQILARADRLEDIRDPLILPVKDLLSRDFFAEAIRRRWRFLDHDRRGGREDVFRFMHRV